MSICFQIITASHSPNYFYAVIPQFRSNFIICLFKGCSNLFINFSIFYKEILNKALKNMISVLPSIIFQLIQRMTVCISCGMNEFTNLKCVSQNFCTTLICPLGKTHKKFSAWNRKKKSHQLLCQTSRFQNQANFRDILRQPLIYFLIFLFLSWIVKLKIQLQGMQLTIVSW